MSSISKATLVLVTLALAVSPNPAGVGAQEADALLQDQTIRRAQWHIDHNEAEAALQLLDATLEEEGNQWTAQFLKGMALGQLGDETGALEAFLAADDLNPGIADVYFWAGIASFGIGDYETCWEQTILAHQAGRNMTLEIEQLREVADPPRDLKERLAAPRAFVAEMDTSVGEHDAGLETALLLGRVELMTVQQQLAQALRNSSQFGLVRAREIADYVVVLNVSDYGSAAYADSGKSPGNVPKEVVDPEMMSPYFNPNTHLTGGPEVQFTHELQGHLELVRADTGTAAFSVPLSIEDITSMGDLTRELRRYVGYLERWARDEG